MNDGERTELRVKLRLIELRDAKQSIKLKGKIIPVNSVSFKGVEFSSIPSNVDIRTLSDYQLEQLSLRVHGGKAGIYDKADVYINGVGYSIKSLAAAPPALVNHTARPGWERVCNSMKIDISELDDIIAEYWSQRIAGKIKEDVHNDDKSPFFKHKEYLVPILNYFLFTGTGARDSQSPADYILDIRDPFDEATWTSHGKEYLEENWENLVFSLRSSKGMGNYPYIADCAKNTSMSKWTKLFQGGHKGALHVRFKDGK